MLTSQQKILRRFWYATTKLDDLQQGPKPFKLLGENAVQAARRKHRAVPRKGEPAALMDRCCHRTSKLSKGSIGSMSDPRSRGGWSGCSLGVDGSASNDASNLMEGVRHARRIEVGCEVRTIRWPH